jgi:predicted O-linked N-acetylglucosamine transferase (SPINDLY family)
VVVDLAGHATANRIGVIAQRVAPLQVCWLDWFDSTAVPAIDAWISDAWLTPADSTQRYSERIVRLGAGRFCYSPPPDAPPPAREHGGAPVFASFNRLARLNEAVVGRWADILRRAPRARLVLRARHLAEAATRAHVAARFVQRGIAAERLELGGALPYRDLLDAYRHVDIALDPFPSSACTTTCDALWMGCATVTLPGETFVSRQSASLLWRLGRPEWVARDGADYVERALALAADVESLRAQRAQLREQVRLRLCDAQAQAVDFAAALRGLWRERCAMAPH